MKFKLLHGFHSHGGTTYKPGSFIESDIDLVKRFNSPGSRKFERIQAADPEVEQAAKAGFNDQDEPSVIPLEELTVKQLRREADELEVDLTGYSRKEEIINALRDAGCER